MVMKTKVRGKAFVFGKNIDTDQIYPGRFVEYTDVEDIKKYGVDVFVIGDDWEGKFDFLKEFCEVVYLKRTEDISSSDLKKVAQ